MNCLYCGYLGGAYVSHECDTRILSSGSSSVLPLADLAVRVFRYNPVGCPRDGGTGRAVTGGRGPRAAHAGGPGRGGCAVTLLWLRLRYWLYRKRGGLLTFREWAFCEDYKSHRWLRDEW